ncbi:aminoglycoside phosphotransferase family protein [Streptomyces sp. NBC_00846]|uniref:phosphotransferase family protein n=1 Tax=Streptomyces sp. NBC_00846 TaxID=2975849 RepID=UPI00386DF1A2|nr:aminoglycoside phosphotransferase family protein [Streptomyces sp. NBC_00846]
MTALPAPAVVAPAAGAKPKAASGPRAAGTASEARTRAAALVPDESLLVGPLNGYHHETYAFPLPADDGSGAQTWWKCRYPRAGLLRFDLRRFASEEALLGALQGRVTRIPVLVERRGISLYSFIEGRTLGEVCPLGTPLSRRHLNQLGGLFRELTSVDVDETGFAGSAGAGGLSAGREDDPAAFLTRLIGFTEYHVYRRHLPRYGSLFAELGVHGAALDRLRREAARLTPRPFTLVHGDLHRENFIVDADGDLWTIDWELAMVGDPLYDLATHLHLMGYPQKESERVTGLWCEAVESARPGASAGWERDLPVLLKYKQVQSVYTDVIRTALAPGQGQGQGRGPGPRLPARAPGRIREVLAAAAIPLELARVPTSRQVRTAYENWFMSQAPTTTSPATAP